MLYLSRWWCHFDDDNYVHISRLVELLRQYSALDPIYLGKPSTAKPLEIFADPAIVPPAQHPHYQDPHHKVS